jgi:hypothetical protein
MGGEISRNEVTAIDIESIKHRKIRLCFFPKVVSSSAESSWEHTYSPLFQIHYLHPETEDFEFMISGTSNLNYDKNPFSIDGKEITPDTVLKVVGTADFLNISKDEDYISRGLIWDTKYETYKLEIRIDGKMYRFISTVPFLRHTSMYDYIRDSSSSDYDTL